ncbi:Asparagine synthetase domain-containing protein 1 isoform B [Glycine soja]|uniref:Asparagine synthetase domain-containing protein 1 isoform B n=1 Tax=Glycine soja TaxID=3848 RepID=A0A445EZY0_GLYSO|nr:Asparagine synthetase domain-containing protein 1 isoform B [Glycine soja]
MCGIALIVSGIRIDTSSLPFDSTTATPTRKSEKLLFSLDDLKEALRRRGPDSFGAKKVLLQLLGQNGVSSFTVEEDGDAADGAIETAKLHFFGATLQLRGINPLVQPLTDASGNVLVYNGEIFGGLHLASDCNDAEFLLQTLGECCSCGSCATDRCVECGKSSIAGVLSAIKGPWAIIYWQDSSRTLWFGRDAFGRRSLLVHWPTVDDSTFLLSSVSPVSPVQQASEYEDHNGIGCLSYWEELPCGIYSVHVDASKTSGYLVGEVKIHEYTNSMLNELIKWERISVEPSSEDLHTFCHKLSLGQHAKHQPSSEAVPNKTGSIQPAIPMPAHILLNALKESVLRRTSMYTVYQAVISGIRQEKFFPVAILFSGGLDSMILAALLDKCMDPSYEIDLLNVSFDGQLAPDRKSAKAGLNELRRVAPSRKWRLVEIDADLSDLVFETSHVMSLINPANTYMDLNIGIALWLAAGGDGWVSDANTYDNDGNHVRIKYKSNAKILLVGSGADEQCAGYGRHRTSYRRGSWLGLHEEMRLDMQRIWRRNLGRDDRCIADNGKEVMLKVDKKSVWTYPLLINFFFSFSFLFCFYFSFRLDFHSWMRML